MQSTPVDLAPLINSFLTMFQPQNPPHTCPCRTQESRPVQYPCCTQDLRSAPISCTTQEAPIQCPCPSVSGNNVYSLRSENTPRPEPPIVDGFFDSEPETFGPGISSILEIISTKEKLSVLGLLFAHLYSQGLLPKYIDDTVSASWYKNNNKETLGEFSYRSEKNAELLIGNNQKVKDLYTQLSRSISLAKKNN